MLDRHFITEIHTFLIIMQFFSSSSLIPFAAECQSNEFIGLPSVWDSRNEIAKGLKETDFFSPYFIMAFYRCYSLFSILWFFVIYFLDFPYNFQNPSKNSAGSPRGSAAMLARWFVSANNYHNKTSNFDGFFFCCSCCLCSSGSSVSFFSPWQFLF